MRGMKKVEFGGDIPEVYGQALAKIMMSKPAQGEEAGWVFPTVDVMGEPFGFHL
jgi:hypothetical protein